MYHLLDPTPPLMLNVLLVLNTLDLEMNMKSGHSILLLPITSPLTSPVSKIHQ